MLLQDDLKDVGTAVRFYFFLFFACYVSVSCYESAAAQVQNNPLFVSYSTQNTAEFAKLYKPVCTFGRVRGDTVMCKQTQLCQICVKID